MTSPGSGAQRLLMREVNAKFARLNTPIQATVELTYRCNLRCGHCFVDREETDELTLEEWQDIFPQLREAGIIFLCFTGGEVLLRPDFLDLAFQARRDGFIVGLLTNCTLITPDIARAIAEMKPFLVATSLYGAKAATHESVTMVPGSFEHTLRGIQLLVDAGLVPTVHIAIMKNNLVELPQIVELVEGQGAKAAVSFGMVPSKTGSEYPCHYEPGFEGLFGCGVSPENLGSTELLGQLLCRAGKSICAISPQGDIYPCIMFPLKLGNIRHSSFDAIWRRESCAELRYLRSMRRSDLSACNECELSAYCIRCTGIAYLESGRVDGPSPSACRQAQIRWRLTQATEVKSCQKNPT